MDVQDQTNAKQREADDAFTRELPGLLRQHGGGWVAYDGDERIGVAATKVDIYERCFSLGLERGEFLVRSIEAAEVELAIGHLSTSDPVRRRRLG